MMKNHGPSGGSKSGSTRSAFPAGEKPSDGCCKANAPHSVSKRGGRAGKGASHADKAGY